MLISHDYKFIFVKTRKTAGSSLETYLKGYCENGFIGKKLKHEHATAATIKQMVGEEIWSSYTKIVPIRNPWDKTVSLYFWRGRKRPFYYYLHRWLIQWRFAPLMEQHISFEEWINRKGEKWLNENRRIMYIDGKLENYEFIRYESLTSDLASVCKKLNIPFDENLLPHEKGGFRPKRDYKSFYNEETKLIVAKAYDQEIKEFNYTF